MDMQDDTCCWDDDISHAAASPTAPPLQDHHSDVKVVVRIRPPLLAAEEGAPVCVEVDGHDSLVLQLPGAAQQMFYSYVAGPSVSQEDFFQVVGRPTVDNSLGGFNSAIFAYGQTGSGKTYTMFGPSLDSHGKGRPACFSPTPSMADLTSPTAGSQGGTRSQAEAKEEQAGLMPRMLEYLFQQLQQQTAADAGVAWLVRCSMLEIYCEEIQDLLVTGSGKLQLREDTRLGVHVAGLSDRPVTSAEDALRLINLGFHNRQTAATAMNAQSSRSHCVLTVSLERRGQRGGLTSVRTARLHLVDLAGNERLRTMEGAPGRIRETSSINTSLTVLGLVILRLTERQAHIPYRNSKLTFLLQDSIGGNAKTVIIANVSPSVSFLAETMSTLGFATRARKLVNKPVVNEDTSGDVTALRADNQRLQRELAHLRTMVQASAGLRSSMVMTVGSLPSLLGSTPAQAGPLPLLAELEERNQQLEAEALQAQQNWEELSEQHKLLQEAYAEQQQDEAAMKLTLQQLNREIRRLQRRLFQGGDDTSPLASSTDPAAAGGDAAVGGCAQAAVATGGGQQPMAVALDQLLELAFQAVGDAVVQSLNMQQEQDQPQQPTQPAASTGVEAANGRSSNTDSMAGPPRAAVLGELESQGTGVASLSQLQSCREQLDQQGACQAASALQLLAACLQRLPLLPAAESGAKEGWHGAGQAAARNPAPAHLGGVPYPGSSSHSPLTAQPTGTPPPHPSPAAAAVGRASCSGSPRSGLPASPVMPRLAPIRTRRSLSFGGAAAALGRSPLAGCTSGSPAASAGGASGGEVGSPVAMAALVVSMQQEAMADKQLVRDLAAENEELRSQLQAALQGGGRPAAAGGLEPSGSAAAATTQDTGAQSAQLGRSRITNAIAADASVCLGSPPAAGVHGPWPEVAGHEDCGMQHSGLAFESAATTAAGSAALQGDAVAASSDADCHPQRAWTDQGLVPDEAASCSSSPAKTGRQRQTFSTGSAHGSPAKRGLQHQEQPCSPGAGALLDSPSRAFRQQQQALQRQVQQLAAENAELRQQLHVFRRVVRQARQMSATPPHQQPLPSTASPAGYGAGAASSSRSGTGSSSSGGGGGSSGHLPEEGSPACASSAAVTPAAGRRLPAPGDLLSPTSAVSPIIWHGSLGGSQDGVLTASPPVWSPLEQSQGMARRQAAQQQQDGDSNNRDSGCSVVLAEGGEAPGLSLGSSGGGGSLWLRRLAHRQSDGSHAEQQQEGQEDQQQVAASHGSSGAHSSHAPGRRSSNSSRLAKAALANVAASHSSCLLGSSMKSAREGGAEAMGSGSGRDSLYDSICLYEALEEPSSPGAAGDAAGATLGASPAAKVPLLPLQSLTLKGAGARSTDPTPRLLLAPEQLPSARGRSPLGEARYAPVQDVTASFTAEGLGPEASWTSTWGADMEAVGDEVDGGIDSGDSGSRDAGSAAAGSGSTSSSRHSSPGRQPSREGSVCSNHDGPLPVVAANSSPQHLHCDGQRTQGQQEEDEVQSTAGSVHGGRHDDALSYDTSKEWNCDLAAGQGAQAPAVEQLHPPFVGDMEEPSQAARLAFQDRLGSRTVSRSQQEACGSSSGGGDDAGNSEQQTHQQQQQGSNRLWRSASANLQQRLLPSGLPPRRAVSPLGAVSFAAAEGRAPLGSAPGHRSSSSWQGEMDVGSSMQHCSSPVSCSWADRLRTSVARSSQVGEPGPCGASPQPLPTRQQRRSSAAAGLSSTSLQRSPVAGGSRLEEAFSRSLQQSPGGLGGSPAGSVALSLSLPRRPPSWGAERWQEENQLLMGELQAVLQQNGDLRSELQRYQRALDNSEALLDQLQEEVEGLEAARQAVVVEHADVVYAKGQLEGVLVVNSELVATNVALRQALAAAQQQLQEQAQQQQQQQQGGEACIQAGTAALADGDGGAVGTSNAAAAGAEEQQQDDSAATGLPQPPTCSTSSPAVAGKDLETVHDPPEAVSPLLVAALPPAAAAEVGEVGTSISCSPVAALAAWTQQLQQSPEDLELQQRQREQLAEQLVSTAARLAEQKRRMQLDGLSAAQSSRRRQRRRLEASSTFPHQQHDQQQQAIASRHQAGDWDDASCGVSLADLEAEMSEIRRALEPELDLLHEVDTEQQGQQQQQAEADPCATGLPQVDSASIEVQQQDEGAAASGTCLNSGDNSTGAAGVDAPAASASMGQQHTITDAATHSSSTEDVSAAEVVVTPTAGSSAEARPASLSIDPGSRPGSRRTSESGVEKGLVYCDTPASNNAAASTSSSVTRSSSRSTSTSASGSTGSGSFHATFQGLMHQLQAVAERSLQDSVQLSQQQGQQQAQQQEEQEAAATGPAAAASAVDNTLLEGSSGVTPSSVVSPAGSPSRAADGVPTAQDAAAAASTVAAPAAAAPAAAGNAQPAAVDAWYQVASAHSLLAAQAGVAGLQQLFALKEELQGLAKSSSRSSSRGRHSRAAGSGPLAAEQPGAGVAGDQQRTSKRRRDHSRAGRRSPSGVLNGGTPDNPVAGPASSTAPFTPGTSEPTAADKGGNAAAGGGTTAPQLSFEVPPAAAAAAAMEESGEAQQDAGQGVAELPLVPVGTPPSTGASSRRRPRCLAATTTPGGPSSPQQQHGMLWRQVQQERQQHIATLQRYATLLQEKQGLQQLLHHQEVELELLRSMQALQKMRAERGSHQVPGLARSTSIATDAAAEPPRAQVRLVIAHVDPSSDAAAAGRLLAVQLLVEEEGSTAGPSACRPSSGCSMTSSNWGSAAGCEDTPWAGLSAGSTPATSRSPSPATGHHQQHQQQPDVMVGVERSADKEGPALAAAVAADGAEQCLRTPAPGPGRQHTAVSPILAEGDSSPSGDSGKAAQLCEQLVLLQVRVQELEAHVEVADKMRKQATTALRAYQQQQQQQQQQQIVGVNSGDDTSLPQPTPRGSTDAALVTKLHSQNRQLQQQWLAQQEEIRQLKDQLAAAAASAAAGTAGGAAGAATPCSRLRVLPPGPSTPRHLRRGMPPTPGRHLQQPSSRLQPLAQQQQQQQVLQAQPQLQPWVAPVSLSPPLHVRGGGSPDAGQPRPAHTAWRQAQQSPPVPIMNLLTPRRALGGSSILSQISSSDVGSSGTAAAAAAATPQPAGSGPLETPRRRYAASPWPRLPDVKAVVQQAQSSGSQGLDPVMDD